MKKIALIFASALFVGVTAANAQSPTSDTTKNRNKSTQQTPQTSSDQMKSDKSTNAGVNSSQNSDRTIVRSSEVPASLRQSLQGSEYTGWESGKLYRTKNGEYLLEMNSNGTTKTHRFNANGKPIKE
jgi:hypothetical protein